VALSDIQQFSKLLKDSNHVLIVFNPHDTGDALASSLTLKNMLEKQAKQVDIAADGFVLPKNLKFLAGDKDVKPALAYLQKFTIKVDTTKAKIDTISYDIKDNWLSIYLTPQSGVITKNELRTAQSTFKYDVILTLNSPDLETLGNIFLNNTDLFYRTPVINIDYHANNEYYGQLNIVDITSTSCSEILYQIIKQTTDEEIDKKNATQLLAGMIIATQGFKNSHVTPHTLSLASQLIKMGAEREMIIQNIYRTRSLSTLKLWGKALTHLKQDSTIGLVWTMITREDFIHSEAHPEDLKGIIDELIMNSPEAKIALLLYEPESSEENRQMIHGIIHTEQHFAATDLVRPFMPSGDKQQASFTIQNKSLSEAEEDIIKFIKNHVDSYNKK
jgi:nanoRNase/pAp phosphatase (c-di-AMP/oligoRNAs hydrolase)